MVGTYFVDAWFFIALFDRRDSHHFAARKVLRRLERARTVTHDYVLSEVLAHFADDGPASRSMAVTAVRNAALLHEVIPSSRELFIAGLELYAVRPDKEWSHVDCVSMSIMRQRGITHVLTNDHHFAQAGFTIVNE